LLFYCLMLPFFLFLPFLSLFYRDFKCFISKDSNIAGFAIYADWGKTSWTYEVGILFTYLASIVCPLPFLGCG
jgi:hypothetical protein